MLAHKAVHEAHVAAEVIAGELQGNKELASAAFNARVIPSVAYTDPEVAWVGLTEDQAKAQGIKVKKGLFPWTASGRAIANGRDEGVTKLLFDDSPEAHGHGKILGGGMVGTHAGDMIGQIALAIEMGADAVHIGKTIHPHPTLGGGEYGHGGGSGAWQLYGCAAGQEVIRTDAQIVKARIGNGSAFFFPSARR
jgi:dihydrolipoamide dehydrogenase